MKSQVVEALDRFAALPSRKRYDDEAVLCLRLHPDRTAKTYDPKGIFEAVRDLENVGSRNYKTKAGEVAQTERIKKQLAKEIEEITGRLVFIRSNDAGFRRLLKMLDQSELQLSKEFCVDVRGTECFDLLKGSEQLHFPDEWKKGRVELVLHPSKRDHAEQMNFFRRLFDRSNGPERRLRAAPYPDGPTFISCYLNRSGLEALADANPLRAAHPLVFAGLEELRSAPVFAAPPPSVATTRSAIRVGIFDGGIDVSHPHLKTHAEQDEDLSIETPPDLNCIAHGTAVAGAVLYGPLNGHDTKQPLPTPQVSVVSVRTLPTSSKTDPDLYECIDIIEAAVPARKDVMFWNISFGPRGPITDDSISRFTYALDTLAVAHKVSFCVAVGNDGDVGPDLNRIQSPSDLVNGLGVGAHTHRENEVIHASYSCQGPGRECGKTKPEVTAFGGCDQFPIQLIAFKKGHKVLTHGTSFASPQVAALAGQALGRVERSSALLARALVVHTAQHPRSKPDSLLGYGAIASSFDEVVRCEANHVTICFQGELLAKKHTKLPVLLPENVVNVGMVTITWTIVALPPVNALHPADYTALCIEDAFYPHCEFYEFRPPKEVVGRTAKRLHIKNDADEIKSLLAQKWKKSEMPLTDSSKYRTEHQQRSSEQKWEPLVKKLVRKDAESLRNPFLVLHAIPRQGASGRLDFAAVVSIHAPKFGGDLHDIILRKYPALQPVRLRAETELRVQV